MKRQKLAAMLLTAAISMFPMAGSLTASANPGSFSTPPPSADSERKYENLSTEEKELVYAEIIVNQVNNIRVKAGLRELYIWPWMNQFTKTRSDELTVAFSHKRPDGSGCFTVLPDGFFYNYVAENIAAGNSTPLKTFDQWINSEKHYANIMTPEMTHISIGYTFQPGTKYTHHWSMLLLGEFDDTSTPQVYPGQYLPLRDLGDVDGNKIIDAMDARQILEYTTAQAAGVPYPVSSRFPEAADVNMDGQINAIDANIVLDCAANSGIDPTFSVTIDSFIW